MLWKWPGFWRLQQQLESLPNLCSHCRKVTNVDTITQALVRSTCQQTLTRSHKLFLVKSGSCFSCVLSSLSHPALRRRVFRHFVKLRHTYGLRNTMGQDRMNHAVTCYVHSDRNDAVDLFDAWYFLTIICSKTISHVWAAYIIYVCIHATNISKIIVFLVSP